MRKASIEVVAGQSRAIQARCPHCERLIHWGDGFDEWLYTADYRLVPFYWKVNGRRLMCQNCGRYSLVPENLWDSAAE